MLAQLKRLIVKEHYFDYYFYDLVALVFMIKYICWISICSVKNLFYIWSGSA